MDLPLDPSEPIPIDFLPGYSINRLGDLFGPRFGTRRKLATYINPKGGHVCITLCGATHFIHCLLLTVFVSPRPEGLVCRHLDGNPLNNNLSNLSWGTPRENYDDVIKHGVSKRPPSAEDIFAIKFLRNLGLFQQQITDVIGIPRPTVSRWLLNYA
jgi:hypothetical protein